jgi:hypothetical protein
MYVSLVFRAYQNIVIEENKVKQSDLYRLSAKYF